MAPMIRAAFENRDDHDIGDADATNEEGNGAEAEEETVVGQWRVPRQGSRQERSLQRQYDAGATE